jgi:NAD(P)H-dependent FMN reductase
MKITIICGSQRINSESLRVSKFIEEMVQNNHKDLTIDLIDLPMLDFPRLHSVSSTIDETWQFRWLEISKQLKASDGFIIVSPEWNGSATPSIKNFFLLCSNFELWHKPALLVACSSGHGGSFTIAELRSFSYKNTMINYIPEHIIIRKCHELLLTQEILETDNKTDVYMKKRLKFSTDLLVDYAKCMKPLRKDGDRMFELSPHGMS